MKLACHTSTLGTALGIVSRSIGKNVNLPILNNVLLEASDLGLNLSATNLEIAITKLIAAEVSEKGSITVGAKLLTDFVNVLPEGEVTLTLQGSVLHLSCGHFTTNINGISASEFPPVSRTDKSTEVSWKNEDFLRAISQVEIAPAVDDSRPILTGIYLKLSGNILTLASTDGHRLALRTIKMEASDLDIEIIIPAHSLSECTRAFKSDKEPILVNVSLNKTWISFKTSTTEIFSRLIEGKYPNFKEVIPTSVICKVLINKANLAAMMKSVSVFARESGNVVRMKYENQSIVIAALGGEQGDSRADMEAKGGEESIEIAFNARYMLEALAVMDGDEIELGLNDGNKPAVLRTPNSDFVYVIMPIRIPS